MDLLVYIAFPIATMILAVVLQKILRCPILVSATFFAIFLIIAFAFYDSTFLLFVFIYSILAYISAYITRFICENIGKNGLIRNINADNINTNIIRTNELNSNNNNFCCCNRNRCYRR